MALKPASLTEFQNFFGALQCFAALRCAKHCNAQKILKISVHSL